ncbi:MAG: isoprenoid biosynthesis glyoxalase ElbB [Desulfobacterales bacterium]|jgi:enhancing lycopene biosynthesis protein 2|nr:isoprenoid biosynthesis glyoxalase ElbB [Desulfobacterales bacterium]MDD3081362.1 isoprenoid biosynthesis glyoxalase ElbB [Desulfobacterales bacterium]MDD3950301.1 isoprenoid biosynthesis glyoxalase ElbB [Desulfobacterales bacterium]MDY0377526.1 isoprenoid biosynthesis glyoxalase ElbB [Desulfobacterales bacterium]
MAKIGVLLSGCGVYDGSEIHEAVLTLLALDRAGAETICMAPDIDQFDVVNHLTGKTQNEKRSVLAESARIARGNIRNLKTVKAADIDGLIIPGGFGAAKNLSNFAVKGKDAEVNPETRRLLKEMQAAGKPIGAICIAPATLTRALAEKSPQVTIGNDPGTAEAIEAMGGVHHNCSVDRIHVDAANKLVTTPAYMLGPGIKEVAVGIEKLVHKVLELAG